MSARVSDALDLLGALVCFAVWASVMLAVAALILPVAAAGWLDNAWKRV